MHALSYTKCELFRTTFELAFDRLTLLDVEVLDTKVLDTIVHCQQCVQHHCVNLKLLIQLEQHCPAPSPIQVWSTGRAASSQMLPAQVQDFTRWSKEYLFIHLLDHFKEGM
jgi:hypothetical protein